MAEATPTMAEATPTQAATEAPTEAPTSEPTPVAVTCDTPLRVGLVTDVGRVNDKGFNQSAYEGMLAAQTAAPTCFETDFIETISQSDYQANIAQFTDAGYDVVIGVGFLLGNDLGDAAKENPEIVFVSVDGIPEAGHDESWFTNGESLFFAEDQAGYLAGVLAASMSETDHIGVVGGLLVVPPVELFVEGYINGARSVNPDITVDFVYTTSFVDPPQGSNAAQQMLDQGADVIFAAGGLTGNGALSAACERRAAGDNVWAIGVDTDQFETLPEVQDCLLSSATKNILGAVRDSLLRIAAAEYTPGVHVDNAATGGIGLAPFHNFEGDVPQDVIDLLDQTFAGLADGSIVTGAVVDQNTVVPDSGPIVP
jgi:basic membrane protein A and related proteins